MSGKQAIMIMLCPVLDFAFQRKLDAEMPEDILGIIMVEFTEIDPVLAIINGSGSLC